ncbi:MAG: hypothetical protein AAFQ45_06230 [Pseudomonadota bacterium]
MFCVFSGRAFGQLSRAACIAAFALILAGCSHHIDRADFSDVDFDQWGAVEDEPPPKKVRKRKRTARKAKPKVRRASLRRTSKPKPPPRPKPALRIPRPQPVPEQDLYAPTPAPPQPAAAPEPAPTVPKPIEAARAPESKPPPTDARSALGRQPAVATPPVLNPQAPTSGAPDTEEKEEQRTASAAPLENGRMALTSKNAAAAETKISCVAGNRVCPDKLAGLMQDKSLGWISTPARAEDYVSGARLIAYDRLKPELSCKQMVRGLEESQTAIVALGAAITDENALGRPTKGLTATRRIALAVRDRLLAARKARC